MFNIWGYTLVSVIIVSLISLIGIFTLTLKKDFLNKILLFLVSFAAGALFGDSFLHLLPEVSEAGFGVLTSIYLLLGIVIFFILEKFIHWHHCHVLEPHDSHPEPYALTNLVGDGLHNLIDGMIIAGSYLASIPLGMATTIAVVLHEIPQEIGDFGVLIHGGFTKLKALMYNLLSASLAVIGAVIILGIGTGPTAITSFLIPFTAGGFIYIAGSDLIPQLHKETRLKVSFIQLASFLLGILIMFLLLFLE